MSDGRSACALPSLCTTATAPRDRVRLRPLLVAAAVGLLAVAGCGRSERLPERFVVTGKVTAVERAEGDVRAFSVSHGRGTVVLRIGGDVDYGFPVTHLEEHRRTGDPVRCLVERDDGQLYALRIDDG